MVVLTPIKDGLDPDNLDKWPEVERSLLQQKVSGAIYFAHRDETTLKLYEELSKEITATGATSWIDVDSYRFEVLPPEAAPINEVKVHNIQGWLAGASKGSSGDSLPTIAIVASYDSFGIAPGLATGADSNGSGVVALLELARLYSRLYRGAKTQGEYNILFLLTGAGRMNFVDTKLWLEKADPRLLETIEFAICLDSIGTGQGLNFHVSRSEKKDQKTKQIYDAFSSTAAQMNIPFEIVIKKINISSDVVPWQHEHFSRKHILSASLSNLEKPMPHMSRSNIFDTQVQFDILTRNIKFVAEGLSRYIYNLNKPNISIFADDLALSSDFISSWTQAISRYPRMMPYLSTKAKDAKESVLITGLEKELSKHVADVSRKTVILSKEDSQDYIFYDKMLATLSAFRGKPVSFDIILSIVISIYLIVLYTVLKGPRNTWLQIQQIFAGSKKKRTKIQ